MLALALAVVAAVWSPSVPVLQSRVAGDGWLLAVSPDGSWAAASHSPRLSYNNTRAVQFWDVKTGTLRASATARFNPLSVWPQTSPDGRRFLVWPATDEDAPGVLIDTATGHKQRLPYLDRNPLGFTPDGTAVYAFEQAQVGTAAKIAVRSVADGTVLRRLAVPDFYRITLAPDGRTAHCRHNGGKNTVWDFVTGKQVCELVVGGDDAAYHPEFVGFAGGGKKVVATAVGVLWVFDSATGKRERTVTVPRAASDERLTEVAVADDLSAVFGGTHDGYLVAFEPDTGRVRWRVKPDGPYHRILTSRDAAHLVRQYGHCGPEVYDAATGELRHALRPDTQVVRSLAFAADGKTLLVATANKVSAPAASTNPKADPPLGHLHVWDATTGELRRSVVGIDPGVCGVFPSADGSRAVVAAGVMWPEFHGHPMRAAQWDVAAGKELLALAAEADGLCGFAASADGRRLAAVKTERRPAPDYVVAVRTRVWDLPTGKVVRDLPATPTPFAVALTPDGEKVLASVQKDRVELWDVAGTNPTVLWRAAGRPLPLYQPFDPQPLPGGDEFVALVPSRSRHDVDLCWFIGGRQIAFGGIPRRSLPIRGGQVAVSPDGRWVAAAEQLDSEFPRAFLWKLPAPPPFDEKTIKDGVIPPEEFPIEPAVLAGHTLGVNAVAFSPDARTLATGGTDGAVRLWDVRTGALRATLWVPPAAKPGTAPTDWVAFTPTGFHAGTPRGLNFLRFAIPPDPLHRPDKVRAAVGGR
jgi:WD40 repeat protein